MTWNPYYVAFAAAHGQRPEAMRALERERWPGGPATGFLLWMSARWGEWHALRRLRRFDTILSEAHHADFGGWLRGWAFRAAELAGG